MNSKSDKVYQYFQSIISYDLAGIIWESSHAFNEKTEIYHSLDYFFDGLLSKTSLLEENQPLNLFFTTQFGHPFCLLHLTTETDTKFIKETLPIMKKKMIHPQKVFYISDLDKKSLKHFSQIKKNFDEVEFSSLSEFSL